MTDLLQLAVDAHGGLERWNELTSVAGRFSIGGAIWGFKGVPDVFGEITVALDLHAERVTIDPVAGPDTHTVFADGRLELRSGSGDVVQTVEDPKQAMARLAYDAPWNALDAAYFASEAWWTYLTAPFLFTYPGFRVQEVEPFTEEGIRYRTLKVGFPDDVDSHTAEQFFHFDDDGLLFRHTYTVDILDGATGANYPSNYQTIDGIAVPTIRRIYGYDDDGQKIPDPVLVSIDINELKFR
jgi:hypothetical protein